MEVLHAEPMKLTSKNLYSYCDNNPVSKTDLNGEIAIAAIAVNMARNISLNLGTYILSSAIMKEKITQVKFSKEFDGKDVSVTCSRYNDSNNIWECTFTIISLLHLAQFVVELFNCETLSGAEILFLHFGGKMVSVNKCPENNTYTYYLEVLASNVRF